MSNSDSIQKFIFEQAAVRGELVHLNASYQAVLNNQDYPPAIRQLLGEALACVALLMGSIKLEGTITLQAQGNGVAQLLVVECDHNFHLRGLVHWEGSADNNNLMELFGTEGQLVVTIQPQQGERYQGIIALQYPGLVQCVEHYFNQSEQLPTRLWLAVNEDTAAGLLLQVLPSENVELITWEHVTILADTIQPAELLELSNAEILHRLFSEEDIRLFDARPVSFQCRCSLERIETALRSIDYDEAIELLKKDQQQIITVQCEFCGRIYTFDKVDVERVYFNGMMGDSTKKQ